MSGGETMEKAHVITGTPWHIETLHKKEEDPKRNKNWCVYYFKEQHYCLKEHVFCLGSAHCKSYKVKPEFEKVAPKIESKEEKQEICVEVFEGIKQLPISLINVTYNFAPPSEKKIEKTIQYFKEHGELDKPILVSCNGKKYKLEDQYLRYYKTISNSRFDSTAFKKYNIDLYKAFLKQVASKRFSVSY